jgi:hypothetical protein
MIKLVNSEVLLLMSEEDTDRAKAWPTKILCRGLAFSFHLKSS